MVWNRKNHQKHKSNRTIALKQKSAAQIYRNYILFSANVSSIFFVFLIPKSQCELFIHKFSLLKWMRLSSQSFSFSFLFSFFFFSFFFCFIEIIPSRFGFDIVHPFHICFFKARSYFAGWNVNRHRIKAKWKWYLCSVKSG